MVPVTVRRSPEAKVTFALRFIITPQATVKNKIK
jgi:hypothetical protein